MRVPRTHRATAPAAGRRRGPTGRGRQSCRLARPVRVERVVLVPRVLRTETNQGSTPDRLSPPQGD
jgi:hypothetical protein